MNLSSLISLSTVLIDGRILLMAVKSTTDGQHRAQTFLLHHHLVVDASKLTLLHLKKFLFAWITFRSKIWTWLPGVLHVVRPAVLLHGFGITIVQSCRSFFPEGLFQNENAAVTWNSALYSSFWRFTYTWEASDGHMPVCAVCSLRAEKIDNLRIQTFIILYFTLFLCR